MEDQVKAVRKIVRDVRQESDANPTYRRPTVAVLKNVLLHVEWREGFGEAYKGLECSPDGTEVKVFLETEAGQRIEKLIAAESNEQRTPVLSLVN
jgi:hypothetical protein